MGISLEEYAALHPTEKPEIMPEIEEAAKTYRERQQEREEVEILKQSISRQLEQGNAPQYILYTAIKAIGILTNDARWTERGHNALNDVYEDLAQESFIVDNAAIAAQRLDDMEKKYNAKLKKQLQTQLNGYRKIEKAITEALKAVNELSPEEEYIPFQD
jgi:chaperonin cofactor prefoldin